MKSNQLFLVSFFVVMNFTLEKFIAIAIQNSNPEGDHDLLDRLSQTLWFSGPKGAFVALVNLHRLVKSPNS